MKKRKTIDVMLHIVYVYTFQSYNVDVKKTRKCQYFIKSLKTIIIFSHTYNATNNKNVIFLEPKKLNPFNKCQLYMSNETGK